MIFSARVLENVTDVNHFSHATEVQADEGSPFTFYFQLVDKAQNKQTQGYDPVGLRYIPDAGSTCTVTFLNIDDDLEFTRAATQPFSGDWSIWSCSVLGSDPISGTGSIKITLTSGSTVRTVLLQAVILGTSGSCI